MQEANQTNVSTAGDYCDQKKDLILIMVCLCPALLVLCGAIGAIIYYAAVTTEEPKYNSDMINNAPSTLHVNKMLIFIAQTITAALLLGGTAKNRGGNEEMPVPSTKLLDNEKPATTSETQDIQISRANNGLI